MNRVNLMVLSGFVALLFFSACSMPNAAGARVELKYDSGTVVPIYIANNASFEAGIRLTPSVTVSYVGQYVRKVKFFVANLPTSLSLNVYGAGTSTTPGTLLSTQSIALASLSTNSWNEFTLSSAPLVGAADIWITLAVVAPAATTTVLAMDNGPAYTNSHFVYTSSWQTLVSDRNWCIRGVIN